MCFVTVKVAKITNTLRVHGFLYATLDNADPAATAVSNAGGCNASYYILPPGWELAPAAAHMYWPKSDGTAIATLGMELEGNVWTATDSCPWTTWNSQENRWGATCLVLADGRTVPTHNSGSKKAVEQYGLAFQRRWHKALPQWNGAAFWPYGLVCARQTSGSETGYLARGSLVAGTWDAIGRPGACCKRPRMHRFDSFILRRALWCCTQEHSRR